MKTLKLEEMIVNAVLNPGKKYTHKFWTVDEYITWDTKHGCHLFLDENGNLFELCEYSTYLDGWKEFKND